MKGTLKHASGREVLFTDNEEGFSLGNAKPQGGKWYPQPEGGDSDPDYKDEKGKDWLLKKDETPQDLLKRVS